MPSSDSVLIARAGREMATQNSNNNGGERGNLTPSSSTTLLLSQSPVSQPMTDRVPTLSAFEITSVSDAPPLEGEEVEALGGRSIDAEEMKTVITQDGGNESNRLSSSSGGSENIHTDSQIIVTDSIDQFTGETTHPESHAAIFMNIPPNPSPKPPQDVNGPGAPASRFRRINHYNRGRWSVRETHEPEERPESESKISLEVQMQMGNSPSQVRRSNPPPSSLTTSEYSYDSKLHSRSNSEASFITDHGVFTGPRNDTGALSDKSSVMADTNPSLSRTESNSSLITKSLDEDGERENRSRDIDSESVASIPNTHTPDLQSISSTYNSIERPTQKYCEQCSRRNIKELPLEEQYHTVEATMELLKEQLAQLVQHNSPHQALLKERDDLLKENVKLKERIKELEAAATATGAPTSCPIASGTTITTDNNLSSVGNNVSDDVDNKTNELTTAANSATNHSTSH